MKKFAFAAAALSALAFVARPAMAADIVDTASAAPQFSTLVKLIKAAGLVDTLKGTGPFTVFAPTNDAFAKLPKSLVTKLMSPAGKNDLVKILTYHVIPGKVMAADVMKMGGGMVATVEGAKVNIAVKPSVMVNNAKVTKTDIVCDNGVIHVIDTVLVPKADKMGKMKMDKMKMDKMGKMDKMDKMK